VLVKNITKLAIVQLQESFGPKVLTKYLPHDSDACYVCPRNNEQNGITAGIL